MSITKRSKLLLVFAATFTLAACAAPTGYAPLDNNGYGFSDQKIEDNRYRISFRGNSLTDRETVETYLLFRAAELTLENGYDYFTMVNDETEKETRYVSTYPSQASAIYGIGRPFPYYAWGFPWGPGFGPGFNDGGLRERSKYTAMAYVVLGKGEKPEDDPAAYDARQVAENLSPQIVRPELES